MVGISWVCCNHNQEVSIHSKKENISPYVYASVFERCAFFVVIDNLKKKTTLIGRMDELKNAPVEKHMYVFGMDIP